MVRIGFHLYTKVIMKTRNLPRGLITIMSFIIIALFHVWLIAMIFEGIYHILNMMINYNEHREAFATNDMFKVFKHLHANWK